MTRWIRQIGGAIAATLLATAPAVAATELVTNGGFETGDFTGWTQIGNTSQTGVDIALPYEGDYAAFFGARSFGGISQQIATTAGNNYAVSFWLTNSGQGGNGFISGFGDTTLASFGNAATFPYLQFSFVVLATASQQELAFAFLQGPGFWDIDNISVTDLGAAPVPEPALWALMIVGFALVGQAMRRRPYAVRVALQP